MQRINLNSTEECRVRVRKAVTLDLMTTQGLVHPQTRLHLFGTQKSAVFTQVTMRKYTLCTRNCGFLLTSIFQCQVVSGEKRRRHCVSALNLSLTILSVKSRSPYQMPRLLICAAALGRSLGRSMVVESG